MLFLKQPHILPFLFRRSATTCPIDSNKVSNSRLKPDLCNCVKSGIVESTAPPQQPHKQGIMFWDTLYIANKRINRIFQQKIQLIDLNSQKLLQGNIMQILNADI